MLWSTRTCMDSQLDDDAVLVGLDDVDLGADAMPAASIPTVHPPAAARSLHFWVRYTMVEYLGFMWEHAGYMIHRRRVRWPLSGYLRLKSTLGAALHFVLLRRGRRTYEFQIDQHGIVRTSDTGVSLIGWDDVLRIRTYTKGFMLVLKRGTLPLPLRCLTRDQVESMRAILAARAAGELQRRGAA